MNLRFICFSIFSLFIFSNCLNLEATQLDDPNKAKLFCTGNAVKTIRTDRLLVYLKIERKHKQRLRAYDNNIMTSNLVIRSLKALGLNDTNFETITFTLTEQYKYVYNITTKDYQSVFDGFMATHEILLRIFNLNMAGTYLDTIVRNGGQISSVSFDVSENVEKKERLSLISSGVEDCKNQVQDVLNYIGYEIDKYTNVDINDIGTSIIQQQSFQAPQSASFAAKEMSNASTPVFAGKEKVRVKIFMGVIIRKKLLRNLRNA